MPSLAAEKKKQRKVSGLINSTCSLFKRSVLMCLWVYDHCKQMVSRWEKSKTRAETTQAGSSHFHWPLFSHHPLHSVLGAASGSETGFESDMWEHFGFFRHRYKLTHYQSTFFCTYCVTFQVQSQFLKCWLLLFIQVLICFLFFHLNTMGFWYR